MNQKIIDKLKQYTNSKVFCALFPKLARVMRAAAARIEYLEDWQNKIAKEIESERV